MTLGIANLQSCILYIYSTNIVTEYFKHGVYSPFLHSSKCSLFHNSNVFCSCIIHILYIYSTNIGTEYFKHGIYSPFFPLQNAVCFIILKYSCIIHILYTGCAKIKKNNSGAKRLISCFARSCCTLCQAPHFVVFSSLLFIPSTCGQFPPSASCSMSSPFFMLLSVWQTRLHFQFLRALCCWLFMYVFK